MTSNHGIWNERDADAGRTALRKFADSAAARERRAPTPRERAYMAAVDILYAEGATKQETDSHYADAMHALAQAWPDDNNARLFDSLALMGRSEGVRDAANYARAGVIARHAFGVNPHNPGAAHYWIHAMDDPAHAAGALEAAYALSKIAPDAAHAQHMTSHVFMALGMWDEVARANEAAMRVVDSDMRRLQQPRRACGHYPFWLEYAYFQQGRYRAAMQVLDACKDSLVPTLAWAKSQAGQDATTTSHAAHSTIKRLTASMTEMRAAAVIDSREWNGAATRIVVDTSGLCSTAAWNDFALGYAAAERGDLAAAQAALDNIVHNAQAPAPVRMRRHRRRPRSRSWATASQECWQSNAVKPQRGWRACAAAPRATTISHSTSVRRCRQAAPRTARRTVACAGRRPRSRIGLQECAEDGTASRPVAARPRARASGRGGIGRCGRQLPRTARSLARCRCRRRRPRRGAQLRGDACAWRLANRTLHACGRSSPCIRCAPAAPIHARSPQPSCTACCSRSSARGLSPCDA